MYIGRTLQIPALGDSNRNPVPIIISTIMRGILIDLVVVVPLGRPQD